MNREDPNHSNLKDRSEERGGASTEEKASEKSKKLRWLLGFAALVVVTAAMATYVSYRERGGGITAGVYAAEAEAAGDKDEYYCPMHTSYKSDKPGNCPICSMKLVKLEKPSTGAGQAAGGEQAMPGMPTESTGQPKETPTTPGANTIFVPPQRQQLIGVQSVPVIIKPLVKEIRTVGKVTYDETKLTHIHTKVTGYIEEVFVDFVGKVVKKGEPLFTIYSPDLVATQEEYLLALKSRSVLKDSAFSWISTGSDNLLEATRRRLRLWDITDHEIETLEKEGSVKRALTIYSPVSGIVIERAAYHHGRYVSPDMDLYTIVDLSTVWVLGEVYEYELPYVKEGQIAELEFPYIGNSKTIRGKVTYFYPYLNPKTRTTQIRMEFANPDLSLRPDMFFNVKLRINLGKQLAVPEDSVLDTGTEQYVFVDKGEGYFEPRPVKLGAEAAGYYGIEDGLKAGERVVTAANFILDSESRLKGAFANMGKPSSPEAGQATDTRQTLSVEVLEPKAAKVGKNTVRLVLRDALGSPVEDAQVEVTLFMPQMGSMPPMSSKAILKPGGGGQYIGTIDIPMAWTWETTVTARKAGSVLGRVQTNITAR